MHFLLKTVPLFMVAFSCTNHNNNNNNKATSPANVKTDTIKHKEIESWTLIYNEDDLKIEANSNVEESMIQGVKVKFAPYVWFEDFPAKTFDTISKAALDFSTNKEAKWYITVIKNGYKKGRSIFGGHYELIMWGCGSPCAHGVIVDRKTGQIIHLPQCEGGYEFRDYSLMLIVNPPDENGFYDLKNLDILPPMIYLFDEVKKEFKLLEPKGR